MTQLGELQKNYSKIQAEGAELIAISADDEDETKTTVEELNLTFTVLSDVDLKTITAYNVLDQTNYEIARPATFIVKSDGTIVWITLDLAGIRVPTSTIITELGKL